IRSSNTNIISNRTSGKIDYFVVMTDGSNLLVDSNSYNSNMLNKNIADNPDVLLTPMIGFARMTFTPTEGKFIFTNNVVEGLRNVFFQVGNVPSFKNVVVKDNIVNFNPQSSSQPLFLLKHGHDVATLYNSTIIGNDVTVERGIYNKIDETLKIDYNSCDFDSILFPESDLELELWGSGGEVDNIEYHLKVSKINNIANVVGN